MTVRRTGWGPRGGGAAPEGGLVQLYGSEESVLRAMVAGLGELSEGRFVVQRMIGGEMVTIRGAVVNGVPKIGTALIP